MGVLERIQELEEELKKTKYNKATEHHFGVVKAQIAKLRDRLETQAAKKTKSAGFAVRKSGDASVVLLGFPSVGKSTLLNRLTEAESKVGAYAFTTLNVVPGIMKYNQAKIQVLDVPGIVAGAAAGKGRGREVLSMVRSADLILILIDAMHPEHRNVILKELHDVRVRINKSQPVVKIARQPKGGLRISSTVKLTHLSKKTVQAVLREMKIVNAEVIIRSNVTIDELIDAVEGNRVYTSAITILTKTDLVSEKKKEKLRKALKPDLLISATEDENVDALKELIFSKLGFVRVFLKEINKKPDLDEPMILRKGATIQDVCMKLHRDFVNKFRYARVWGKSAKFPGQQVYKLSKQIRDGDILEIHLS